MDQGRVGASRSIDRLSLRFAELQSNSRLDKGAITEGSEIIMLSKDLNGARVNVCSRDFRRPDPRCRAQCVPIAAARGNLSRG